MFLLFCFLQDTNFTLHAPLCPNTYLCRSKLCQFKHKKDTNLKNRVVDETIENEDEIDGSEESDGEDQEMNKYVYNPLQCDYGLCSFKTIVFATKPDLQTHLRSDHGFD